MIAIMSNDDFGSLYPFMTRERYQALTSGLANVPNEFRNSASSRIYTNLGRGDLTALLRMVIRSCLMDAYKGVEGVEVKYIGQVFTITYDNRYVLHLKKVSDPNCLVNIPKTLRGLQINISSDPIAKDQPLPGFERYVEPTIVDAHILTAVYKTDDTNVLVEFFINDQQGAEIVRSEPIPLSASVLRYPVSDQTIPAIEFDFKTDLQDGDQVGNNSTSPDVPDIEDDGTENPLDDMGNSNEGAEDTPNLDVG